MRTAYFRRNIEFVGNELFPNAHSIDEGSVETTIVKNSQPAKSARTVRTDIFTAGGRDRGRGRGQQFYIVAPFNIFILFFIFIFHFLPALQGCRPAV